MCLIFIPRPAPTGARNRGYRRWFRQEPVGVSRGTGSPWKRGELFRHAQSDRSSQTGPIFNAVIMFCFPGKESDYLAI